MAVMRVSANVPSVAVRRANAGRRSSERGNHMRLTEHIATQPQTTLHDELIPSGSIGLDLALGGMHRRPDGCWQTGYPRGAMIEIYGAEASGTTSLCLAMTANAQALGVRCAYLDMAHRLDLSYAQHLGVDMNQFCFSQPRSGEECMHIAEQLIKSGLFGLVVIDSVSAIGLQTRPMSIWLRSLDSLLATGARCNLVFSNWGQEKVSAALFAQIRLEACRGASLTANGIPYGHRLCVRVIENKGDPLYQQTEMDLIYGRGIDYIGELVDLCVGHGLITVSDSSYSAYGKALARDRNSTCWLIQQDPHLAYRIYDALLTEAVAMTGRSTEDFHQPLPCRPLIAEVGQTAALGQISKNGPVLYVIDVRLGCSTYKGFIFLHHHRQFSKEELDRMIAEAVAITSNVRIATRREQMIKCQTPIENPQRVNESLFKTDMDFFETFLSDKFGFDIVRANVVRAMIEPTVRPVCEHGASPLSRDPHRAVTALSEAECHCCAQLAR